MITLLLICAGIYLFLGEIPDGILLLLSLAGVLAISLYQENRSTRALEALKELSSPRALVVRNGSEKRISSREVVPDDILVLNEGDRIAADALLLESAHLQVDESLLTGESLPATKSPLSEETRLLFASTLVTAGRGYARVIATGNKTEVGKIGKSIAAPAQEKTRLQQEISSLMRLFLFAGVAMSVLIIITYGFTVGDWPQGFLAGLAAAMSLMPEEFPVVLTIFLALGAWRLAQKNVLVRQSAATENLGAITVLCVDKTGTLTMNEMKLAECRTVHSLHSFENAQNVLLPGEFRTLIEFAVLASHRNPFDPMEKALRKLLDQELKNTEYVHDDWVLKREYALSPELLAMTCVWESPVTSNIVVASKGAPESIFKLCKLNSDLLQTLSNQVKEMSAEGLRILGVARAKWIATDLPKEQQDFDFEFLGLLGLKDPVRPEVPKAIEECYQAGIRVLMITGDFPGTAEKVATDIGLREADSALSGPMLDSMTDFELKAKLKSHSVFARMVPRQKLRLVQALKSNREVVAMTGDGVNDAPSLQWADVGIAMGGRGTDVAREAADLVLLDDCFTSIVEAIRSGRKIFDNIQNAIFYIIAVHVPIAGMAIAPILFHLPIVLFPAHIVFLELIIDPSCTLIFESEPPGPDTMKRPPRRLAVRLFSSWKVFTSFFQGAITFFALFGLYFWCESHSFSPNHGRTIVFAAFVFANFGLVIVNRLHLILFHNKSFIWILLAAMAALLSTIYISWLQPLFGFQALTFGDFALAVTVALAAITLNFGISKLPQVRRRM